MSDLLIQKTAILSPCGAYRYRLTREWGDGPHATFIMLNPSTATADIDDPTIRKCMGFARRWNLTGIDVVNLFAYRATDPKAMLKATDPVGPDNYEQTARAIRHASKVICAWGARGSFLDQDETVMGWMLADVRCMARPMCLRLTSKGAPEHPLYVPYEVEPVEYPGRGRRVA